MPGRRAWSSSSASSEFADPVALVRYIGEQGSLAKIRPDQSVVFIRDWPTAEKRLPGAAVVMTQLARLAMKAAKHLRVLRSCRECGHA